MGFNSVFKGLMHTSFINRVIDTRRIYFCLFNTLIARKLGLNHATSQMFGH
jgi:hypothetical protein